MPPMSPTYLPPYRRKDDLTLHTLPDATYGAIVIRHERGCSLSFLGISNLTSIHTGYNGYPDLHVAVHEGADG